MNVGTGLIDFSGEDAYRAALLEVPEEEKNAAEKKLQEKGIGVTTRNIIKMVEQMRREKPQKEEE